MEDLLILSDYPEYDDREKNLKDNHGKYFWHLLLSQNPPRNIHVDFIYDNALDKQRGNSRLVGLLSKYRPKVILALGSTVCSALDVEGTLNKIRGSVFTQETRRGTRYVIPTFHPRELKSPFRVFAEEPIDKGLFTSGDIAKALDVLKNDWVQPEERFLLEPTLDDLIKFHDDAIKNKWLLGCDLEGTGLRIEPGGAEVVTIGFAWSESDAIVVPLLKEHGEPYWPPNQQAEVKSIIESIFKNCSFIFQNGFGYDIPLLRYRGWNFPIESYTDETMVLHHTLSPELPHNIGFISSVYGKQPYWKESFLTRKEHIFETDQIEMREYNARDCVALHQIRNGMLNQIDFLMGDPLYSRVPEVYSQGMDQTRELIYMFERGVEIDKKKLELWQIHAKSELDRYYNEMVSLVDLPEGFSFTADQDVRLLVYGERPPKLDKAGWKEDLLTYDSPAFNYQYECTACGRKVNKKIYDHEEVPAEIVGKCPACKDLRDCKRTEKERTSVKAKSKETDKYRQLKYFELLENVKPIYKLKGYEPLTTKSGLSALDKAAIVRYNMQITARLDRMGAMTRTRERHIEEKEGLLKTQQFLHAYQKWGEFQKLVSSFYDFPTWFDGRVRTRFMPTGTSTGRLSAKTPNL